MLDALEGSESESEAASDKDDKPVEGEEQPANKKKKLTLEDLEATGFKTNDAMLLYMKAPAEVQTGGVTRSKQHKDGIRALNLYRRALQS